MGGIFDINGKFYTTFTKITDFIILALLLEIFSIPIVTTGPAICGVYYVAMREVRDEEGYVWKGFWKSFRQNFKQGLVLTLIIGGIDLFMVLDIYWAYQIWQLNGTFFYQAIMFIILGLAFVFFSISLYVFPLLSKFYNNNRGTLKNAVIVASKHTPTTIIMALSLLAILYFSYTWNLLVLFIGLPIFLYASAARFSKIIEQIIDEYEDEHNVQLAEGEQQLDESQMPAKEEVPDTLPSGHRRPEVILAGRPYTKLSKEEKAEYDLAVEEELNYEAELMPMTIQDAIRMKEEAAADSTADSTSETSAGMLSENGQSTGDEPGGENAGNAEGTQGTQDAESAQDAQDAEGAPDAEDAPDAESPQDAGTEVKDETAEEAKEA